MKHKHVLYLCNYEQYVCMYVCLGDLLGPASTDATQCKLQRMQILCVVTVLYNMYVYTILCTVHV